MKTAELRQKDVAGLEAEVTVPADAPEGEARFHEIPDLGGLSPLVERIEHS